MSTATIDEIVERVRAMQDDERVELMTRLNKISRTLAAEKSNDTPNSKKGFVSPNTIWMRDHSKEFEGQYVALQNGKLIAAGMNFPETMSRAKAAGAIRPLVAFVSKEDGEIFGGW